MIQDFRQAVRSLLRTPGFTIAVALTLALGMGASTSIFSIVDSLAFRPLGYRDPAQLAVLLSVEDRGRARPFRTPAVAQDKLNGWREQSDIFEGIAGYHRARMLLEGSNGEPMAIGAFSADVLAVLGATPALGRGFEPGEMAPGADDVALLSHFTWVAMFGGASDVLSRTITLDSRPYRIIGVMPSRFRFPDIDTQVWIPLSRPEDAPFAVARVTKGLGMSDARQRVSVRAGHLQEKTPRREGWVVEVHGLDERRLQRAMIGVVALAAGGLLSLVACANVAGLLLVRTARRRKELGIRSALGGSRWRVLRQVLVEGVVLALMGGALALAAATWAVSVFSLQLPPDLVSLDARVISFAFVLSLGAGLGCSLVPALRATRSNLLPALVSGARTSDTREQQRFRFALVAIEVALTFVLLVGAALLMNSLTRMLRVDPGFDTGNLVAVGVRVPLERYPTDAARAAFQEDVLARTQLLPGIERATVGGLMPPRDGIHYEVTVEGVPQAVPFDVVITPVADNYFDTLRIPIVEGRSFERSAQAGDAVIAIDRELARTIWGTQSPIGQRLQIRSEPAATVVAVVGRVKTGNFTSRSTRPPTFQAYRPLAQSRSLLTPAFIARTAANPDDTLQSMRRIITTLEPRAIVTVASTADDAYDRLLQVPRTAVSLMTLFAAGALVFAAIGVYGLLAYSVAVRTKEIGIRMALGADPPAVRAMVVREAIGPVAVGLAAGLMMSFGANGFLASLLFELSPHDVPTTLGAVAFFLLTIAGVAWLPARRATRLDPILTLRGE